MGLIELGLGFRLNRDDDDDDVVGFLEVSVVLRMI